ncbi:934_t:CDS:2, partial [Racocetra persica]
EYTCLDFVWNRSFHDMYKHIHAAHLFNDIKNSKTTLNAVKNDLVKYFCKKERAAPAEQKNLIIYNESTEIVFEEILQIFSLQGNDIFFPYEYKTTKKDLFRPIELLERRTSNVETSKVFSAKPRKPSHFLNELTTNNDKEASINDVDNENLMLVDDETELLIAANLEQVEVKRIDEIDDVDIEETNKVSLINATNAEVLVLSPLPPSVQK